MGLGGTDFRSRVACKCRKFVGPLELFGGPRCYVQGPRFLRKQRCRMTPDADDLSSTFVPHVSQSFITQTPLRSSHMHHDLHHPRASYPPDPASVDARYSEPLEGLSSFDDGFKKNVKIDMKDLVGDAVGNVSTPFLLVVYYVF